jgi:glycosyltransferase involved in cell wall biosynthesis
LLAPALGRRIARLAPDAALCAMPAALDRLMAAALARAGVPWALIVHDAAPHAGDSAAFVRLIQRGTIRRAGALVALSGHVARQLAADPAAAGKPLLRISLPPFVFGPAPPPPRAHGGALRLLCFGRLLPYKGLDLLAAALVRLGPRADLAVRVVGQGPESATLAALRAHPGVRVERRWVPDAEIASLLAWADAVVLPYREASQSGFAPAALAAGRRVVATAVGGLPEQLAGAPLARLCAPTPDALAAALAALLAEPPPNAPPADPGAAWRATAADLRAQLMAALPRAR